MWDHVIELKNEFIPRKEKIYLLSKKEKGKEREFVRE